MPSTLEPTIGASIGGQIILGGGVGGTFVEGLTISLLSNGTIGTAAGLVSINCSGS